MKENYSQQCIEYHCIFRPRPAAELRATVVLESLLNFLSGVHHKGTVLHHWLADGAALQNKDLRSLGGVCVAENGLLISLQRRRAFWPNALATDFQRRALNEVRAPVCFLPRYSSREREAAATRGQLDEPYAHIRILLSCVRVRRRRQRLLIAVPPSPNSHFRFTIRRFVLRHFFRPVLLENQKSKPHHRK